MGTAFWLIPGSIRFAGTVWLSGASAEIPAVGAWGAGVLAGGLLAAAAWWRWQRRGAA